LGRRPARNCIVKLRDQKPVQIRIRSGHGHADNRRRKDQFIRIRSKFDGTAEEGIELGGIARTAMDEFHANRLQSPSRQVPAQSDDRHHHELDLMPVRMPRYADIVEPDRSVAAFGVRHGHAFIDEPHITRRPVQRVTQQVGGSRGVIEQAELAKIGRLGQMKSKKPVG
jgi:hypothetical protein